MEQNQEHIVKITWTPADVSALVVFRLDQPNRLRNLHAMATAMNRSGLKELLVYEDPPSNATMPTWAKIVKGIGQGPLHRTKGFNTLAKLATGKIIALADTDCLIPDQRWLIATKQLHQGADVVYPYDGTFTNINNPEIIKSAEVYDNTKGDIIMNNSVGGLILLRTTSFWKTGGEHEGFVGWGYEDDERFWRYNKLNMHVERTPGPLFHLHHDPSPYSQTWGTAQTQANEQLLHRTKLLPPAHWKQKINKLL